MNNFSEENSIEQKEQELPKLYSKTLILVFAILFSTIFAAALLIVNLRSLGQRAAAAWVLLFSVVYMIGTALLMQEYSLSPSLTIVANVIGAAVLNEFFWNKYIGSEREFEKKSWIKPTAISMLIVLALFLIMLTAG